MLAACDSADLAIGSDRYRVDNSEEHTTAVCQLPLKTVHIENGVACHTGTRVGSTAHYYCLSCDSNTVMGTSISERICMENGSWNGSLPHCECKSYTNILYNFYECMHDIVIAV